MKEPQSQTPTAPRWRFRFSLRTLLIAMPILAALLGWLGNTKLKHDRETGARDKLAAKFGGVWCAAKIHGDDQSASRFFQLKPYGVTFEERENNAPWAAADWKMVRELHSLREFRLVGYKGPADGPTFAQASQVRQLSLFDCQLTTSDLQQINALSQLQKLIIYAPASVDKSNPQQRMTQASLDLTPLHVAPQSWPQLASLQLSDMQIPDQSLAAIGRLPTLEVLDMHSCDVHTRALDQLKEAVKLKSLEFSPQRRNETGELVGGQLFRVVDERNLAHWGPLPELTYLSLNDVVLANFGGSQTGRWPQLETLRLSGSTLSTQALREIAAMPKLAELTLTNCMVARDALSALDQSASLTKLEIRSPPILRYDDLGRLPHPPQLRTLDLRGAAFDDRALRDVAELDRLEVLWLTAGDFTDRGVALLENHSALLHVHLYSSRLTNRSLASLAAIKTLSLADCNLISPEIGEDLLAEVQTLDSEGGDVKALLKQKGIAPAEPLP